MSCNFTPAGKRGKIYFDLSKFFAIIPYEPGIYIYVQYVCQLWMFEPDSGVQDGTAVLVDTGVVVPAVVDEELQHLLCPRQRHCGAMQRRQFLQKTAIKS